MNNRAILMVFVLCLASIAFAQPMRTMVVRWSTTIRGEQYITEITEETFTFVPESVIEQGEEPPLTMLDALRLAQAEFDSLCEPEVAYYLDSAKLENFAGEHNYWYYVFVYLSKFQDWVKVEPYRSMREAGEDTTRVGPHITVVVLLDGTVLTPELLINKSKFEMHPTN